MPRKSPRVADALITVELWTGPLTALAARFGMTPLELSRALPRVGRTVRGRMTVTVNSPVAMTTLRRVLKPPCED